MSDPTLPDHEDAVPPAAGQAPSSGAIPRRVTRDRVGACLTFNDYRFTIDNDGDLSSLLDGNPLWFMLMGATKEILQVRGRSSAPIASTNRIAVLRTANDWNRDRIWPKVYVRDADGALGIFTELSVDLTGGVTDAQLIQHLSCAIATAGLAFKAISEAFGHLEES